MLEPCASGKHARCASCTFRERVVTPSAKRKVFIELPQDDEQEGCIGQTLCVFYARRRVNFRRRDLCLFKRLLPHSGARAWEHRFMEATLIPDNEADSISGSTAKSPRRFLLIHSGYWYRMCKTRNQSLPGEGAGKSNELCSG